MKAAFGQFCKQLRTQANTKGEFIFTSDTFRIPNQTISTTLGNVYI